MCCALLLQHDHIASGSIGRSNVTFGWSNIVLGGREGEGERESEGGRERERERKETSSHTNFAEEICIAF